MPEANLTRSSAVNTSDDSIIIQELIEDIPGGRTLDVEGFGKDVIQAGHTIIENDETGALKPMPLNGAGDDYAAKPANHTYVGVLVGTVLTKKPLASVMVRGTVNEEAAKNAGLPSYTSAMKSAIALVRFTKN
ncbi:hypothetical protein [Psychroflexus aestuariivivens]|uniref:hypothetical protein n=1 Tax=Psychroflexus aestuariivivens TaxID=1795040 RepID=UPI000FDB5771|nr:hypothetical protein [Psychroflexus aestuariivivens]